MPSTAGRIQYKTALGQPSFDEMVPQGLPYIENPDAQSPSTVLIRQTYLCRLRSYRRAAANSKCPSEISGGLVATFTADGPRTPRGVADLVTFDRYWTT
jgi:hypothetical protein